MLNDIAVKGDWEVGIASLRSNRST